MFTGALSVIATAFDTLEVVIPPDQPWDFGPPPDTGIAGSARFNAGGVGSYLLYDPAPFVFGTGDFTIEWWQYVNQYGPYMRVFQQGSFDTMIYFGITIENDALYVWCNNAFFNISLDPSRLLTWDHIAVVREGNDFRVYQGGVLIGQSSQPTWDFNQDSQRFAVGTEYGSSLEGVRFTGWLSNFRVVRGRALYDEDFTVSNRFLPGIVGTELLLRFKDPDFMNQDFSANNRQTVNYFNLVPGPSPHTDPYPVLWEWEAGLSTTLSKVDGKFRATATDAGVNPRILRGIDGLEVGATYNIQAPLTLGPGVSTLYFRVSSSSDLSAGDLVQTVNGADDVTFVYNGGEVYIGIVPIVDEIGEYGEVGPMVITKQ